MNYYSIFLSLILSVSTVAQKQFVSFDDEAVSIARQNEELTIVIPFNIIEGYHIQAASDTKDNLIATEVVFEQNVNYKIVTQNFTLTNYETVVLNEFTHRVLSKSLEMTITLKLSTGSVDSSMKLKGQLLYQACDDKQCYFPRILDFKITL